MFLNLVLKILFVYLLKACSHACLVFLVTNLFNTFMIRPKHKKTIPQLIDLKNHKNLSKGHFRVYISLSFVKKDLHV